ncbi:MAG: peptide chain release factor 1 [Candidatus Cloacimonetes bacterium]|nr:peptide chain release factor 1 [Candidatus Cloacimonadota bacterium]
MIPEDKISLFRREYSKIQKELSDPAILADQRYYAGISRRFKELEEIINIVDNLQEIEHKIKDSLHFIQTENDAELVTLAREELEDSQAKQEELQEKLKELLIPRDPNDNKNAIVEIRAGTGGEEAALFVADLYRMYSYYAEKMKWKKNVISTNPTGIGGFKEIIFLLEGNNVYGTMRYESGVHRVQRVPETESSGRIHTSAISVAVLPEADEVDIDINEKDLRIDVYRSTGHGGQSVNTTDSAVRITHLPSGLVVTCQDEKSQIKNKNKAMKVLRSRLLDLEIARQETDIAKSRKVQVGTGDRSAKIRTYNFPQSRVTDHRINLTSYRLNSILVGELEEFIDALKLAHKQEQMNN